MGGEEREVVRCDGRMRVWEDLEEKGEKKKRKKGISKMRKGIVRVTCTDVKKSSRKREIASCTMM